MFNPENSFIKVKDALPVEGERVIVFNDELEEFIDAVFINGKFYENKNELINITKWMRKDSNIIF